jgi:hypothetical protein
VTLTHAAFPEASTVDPDVTERCSPSRTLPDGTQSVNFAQNCGDISSHFFTVLDARDQPIGNNNNNSIVVNGVVRSNTAEQRDFDYLTSSRPRVTNIEFEKAEPNDFDEGGKTQTDIDNALASADPDKAGLISTNRRKWVSFSAIGYQSALAVVPLNSRLRFSFSGVMNQSTVPAPQFSRAPQPVLGWTAAWNAQSNMVVWSHSDLFAGPNQAYSHNGNTIAPRDPIYAGLTQGNGVDIKGDSLYNSQGANDANAGLAVPAANMNTIDVTAPTMTVEYLANINSTSDANKIICVGGAAQAFASDKAIWKPLAGATDVPLNAVIRVRMNETFGPGGTFPDSSIALRINAEGKNNPGTTADSDAGRQAAETQLGLDGNGRPTGKYLINENPLSGTVNAQARQDYKVGDVTIFGAQSLFTLNLVSPAGSTGGDQSRGSYSLRFTGGDTRLDDDGLPANNGEFSNQADNVGKVPGNQVSLVANFTTEDVSLPVVRSITGAGNTALNLFAPDTAIVVDFDEPVDINTVNLEQISKPDGAPDAAFTKAYGNGGNDKSIVIFTPTTPLVRPASGGANTYVFRVKADVLDLRSTTVTTCNSPNKQSDLTKLNGNGTDRFTLNIPVETTPPTVRSITSTREEITIQFSEPVISDANNDNGRLSKSAVNTNNYFGTYLAATSAPVGGTTAPFSVTNDPATSPTRGFVSYTFFDPNRVLPIGAGGANVSSPGAVTVLKKIRDIRYDSTGNAVTLITDPMTEGQGTGQPEAVYVAIPGPNNSAGVNDTITDLNTNSFSTAQFMTAPIQTGRADWVVGMSVTSNQPGASPDQDNRFGVRGIANADGSSANGSATNGFDGFETDTPEPIAPGANHVFLFSARGNNEPGFQGNGGNFAIDTQSRPLLEQSRTWPRIGVQTDLGATGAPVTITVSWNINRTGQEVPATHSVELLNLNPKPGEPTSIDMRSQNSFSYTVENNGLDQSRFFSLVVTAPGVQSAPFQLSEGFNMVGVPVRAQNPAVSNVFFGLSPLVIYRYDPTAGYESSRPPRPSLRLNRDVDTSSDLARRASNSASLECRWWVKPRLALRRVGT